MGKPKRKSLDMDIEVVGGTRPASYRHRRHHHHHHHHHHHLRASYTSLTTEASPRWLDVGQRR